MRLSSYLVQKPAARRIALAVFIAALLIVAAAPPILRDWAGQKDTQDFAPVYRAARAMWNGEDIYAATAGFYIYSPFLAFIFQPLVTMPEHAAAIVWVVLSALLIFSALLMVSKEMAERWRPVNVKTDVSLPWLIAAIALILSFDKIHTDFRLGQTDCLMLLGFACVLRWMDRKPWLAGLAVGAAANIKYLSLIYVPYFVIKRNYRAAAASVVSFIFFIMLPGAEIGFRRAGAYVASAFGALAKLMNLIPRVPGHGVKIFPVSWDRSVSFTSAIFRVTRAHELPDSVAAILVVVAFMIVVATILLIARSHGIPFFKPANGGPRTARDRVASLEWAILIVIAITFGPQITARHMLLVSLVYPLTIGIFFAQKRTPMRALLIASMALMAAGLSLPFRGLGLDNVLWTWRSVAGASWCAVVLILAIVFAGSSAIEDMAETM